MGPKYADKMARVLKFRIKKVEGSYYLCSEKKGADQLRGYREADLRLCFPKRKALISFAVTAKLICVFVFACLRNVGFLMTRLILLFLVFISEYTKRCHKRQVMEMTVFHFCTVIVFR